MIYTFKHSYGWECPICGKNDLGQQNLWECGISEDELDGNLRFLLFMQGRDPQQNEEDI